VARTDAIDLGSLRLTAGEGRRLDAEVAVEPFRYGGDPYRLAEGERIAVRVDISCMTARGYALRLRGRAGLRGPCMRCLRDAAPTVELDVREVDQPGGGDELSSPYVAAEELDLRAWTRDAIALALPGQITCRPDCPGLCPECGVLLDQAGPEHGHARPPDPRWEKLRELKLEQS